MIIGRISVEKDRRKEAKEELRERIERALEIIGEMAESQAKLLCPVDTDRLRGSITYSVQVPTVYVGTDVEYAPYVELGTSKMKAQPFLMPAVKGQIDVYRQVIEEELKR